MIIFFLTVNPFLVANGQLGLTLGGLGNTLDGALGGAPSYSPQATHQIVRLPNGSLVVVQGSRGNGAAGGGLLDLGSLVGGLGLPLGKLPLGRKR